MRRATGAPPSDVAADAASPTPTPPASGWALGLFWASLAFAGVALLLLVVSFIV